MKKNLLLSAVLSIAALTARCEPPAPASETGSTAGNTNASSPPVGQQWQNVKSDITNAWQHVEQTTTQALAAVKTGTTQAWSSVKNSMQSETDYTYSQKDAFIAKTQDKLDALDKSIKKLSGKVASATDATKADAHAKLQNLRGKRADLDKKLGEVKNATEASWNDAKKNFEKAYDDLKKSLKQTWQWMSDKDGQ
jgi:chromosome segregation ATPase